MIEAAALLVIIAGLVRPKWVRNKKAFGWAIVLLVGCLAIYHALAWVRWSTMPNPWYLWGMLRPCLEISTALGQIGCIIALLVAFWPGGWLFRIGEPGADEESSAAGESEGTRE